MVLDDFLLNIQHYKVRIKGKYNILLSGLMNNEEFVYINI